MYGNLPIGTFTRLGIRYIPSAETGNSFAVVNPEEFDHRKAVGDLERRYGTNIHILGNDPFQVRIDWAERSLSIRGQILVATPQGFFTQEFYLQSVPGSFLYSLNAGEKQRAGGFKAVFSGPNPFFLNEQLSDELVTCSFNWQPAQP